MRLTLCFGRLMPMTAYGGIQHMRTSWRQKSTLIPRSGVDYPIQSLRNSKSRNLDPIPEALFPPVGLLFNVRCWLLDSAWTLLSSSVLSGGG